MEKDDEKIFIFFETRVQKKKSIVKHDDDVSASDFPSRFSLSDAFTNERFSCLCVKYKS